MKQTEVKTDRQMTCCISGRRCGYGTDCTALQPDRGLIRYRTGWANIATDKGLYVPMQLLPDSHTADSLSGKLCSRMDCRSGKQPGSRTVKRINNRMTVRISLQRYIQLSRFNNLNFNL
jgi:hypothetical protein